MSRQQAAHLAVIDPNASSRDLARFPQPVERPPLPALPPAVQQLVEPKSRRGRYTEDGELLGFVEEWSTPTVPQEMLPEVRHCLSAVEAVIAPSERGQLLTRILALLSHYRADPNPPQVERLMADDWARDLQEFPMWAVEEAARWWRQNRKFRPAICEMRALCEAAVEDETRIRNRLKAILRKHDREEVSPSSRFDMLAAAAMRRMARESFKRV